MQNQDNQHGIGGSYVIDADGQRRRADEPVAQAVEAQPVQAEAETHADPVPPETEAGDPSSAGESTTESTDSGSNKSTRKRN